MPTVNQKDHISVTIYDNVNTNEYFFSLSHGQPVVSSEWVPCTFKIPQTVVPREGLEDGIIENIDDLKLVYCKDRKEIPNPDSIYRFPLPLREIDKMFIFIDKYLGTFVANRIFAKSKLHDVADDTVLKRVFGKYKCVLSDMYDKPCFYGTDVEKAILELKEEEKIIANHTNKAQYIIDRLENLLKL